eukprot:6744545-Alexandrium_andersonii.AAC.1
MEGCKQPLHQARRQQRVAAAGTEQQHKGVMPGSLLQRWKWGVAHHQGGQETNQVSDAVPMAGGRPRRRSGCHRKSLHACNCRGCARE